MINPDNLNQSTPVLPRRRRSRKRWLARILFILVVPAAIFAWWLNRELHHPVAHGKGNEYIGIPRGSTPEGVINNLVNEGVLRRTRPLLLYIRRTRRANRLNTGAYRVPSPITPLTG